MATSASPERNEISGAKVVKVTKCMAVGASQEEMPGRTDASLGIPAKFMRGSARIIPGKGRSNQNTPR
jgi:hypothetical protein